MKHKSCQKHHAINRFKERLGVSLTEKDYFELCKKCQDRSVSKLVCFTRDYKQVIQLEDFGFRFRVVYDQIKQRIVTLFPDSVRNLR